MVCLLKLQKKDYTRFVRTPELSNQPYEDQTKTHWEIATLARNISGWLEGGKWDIFINHLAWEREGVVIRGAINLVN
jgi:hypothetical protein